MQGTNPPPGPHRKKRRMLLSIERDEGSLRAYRKKEEEEEGKNRFPWWTYCECRTRNSLKARASRMRNLFKRGAFLEFLLSCQFVPYITFPVHGDLIEAPHDCWIIKGKRQTLFFFCFFMFLRHIHHRLEGIKFESGKHRIIAFRLLIAQQADECNSAHETSNFFQLST